MEFVNFHLIPGLVLGCIYALGAIGISLTFGILRFSNFAHGDTMTLGVYIMLSFVWLTDAHPVVVMPFAMALTAVAMLGMDRLFFKPFRRSPPIMTVIASFGLMLMIRSVVQFFWGTQTQAVIKGIQRPDFVAPKYLALLVAVVVVAGLLSWLDARRRERIARDPNAETPLPSVAPWFVAGAGLVYFVIVTAVGVGGERYDIGLSGLGFALSQAHVLVIGFGLLLGLLGWGMLGAMAPGSGRNAGLLAGAVALAVLVGVDGWIGEAAQLSWQGWASLGPELARYPSGRFWGEPQGFGEGLRILPRYWIIFAGTVLLMIATHLLLTRTKIGKAMRATSDNPELASLTGINTERVVQATWVLGASLAVVAGVFLALDTKAETMMGFKLLLPMFAAAILGGIGKPYGAVVGGMVIGIVEELAVYPWLRGACGPDELLTAFEYTLRNCNEPLLSPGYKAGVAFAIMVAMLIWRPQGLFRGRQF